ncbi:adaptin amino-terminal region protein [Medicago truncatula]|uniref:Adaptin amino-terminal region protein n=1 Tax=Medicago truncatula TaxID=3880 RepID=G7JBV2_MEDTR|nr:adaptin amino-terminal region protein [Medicago truncatula]
MEKSCSLVVHFDKGTPALTTEIKESLKRNDVAAKIEALKKTIMLLLNGETIPQLFITVIHYVLTCVNHTVQKLLLLYLEITDKTDSRGKVLPEMVLFTNLRLSKSSRINESEIVEPLIPSILLNLEHRHPFVRRNVVLAVMSVYKLPQGEQLLDSAPEIVEKFLVSEQDVSRITQCPSKLAGNSVQPFNLFIDTGTDFTWVQCFYEKCQGCTMPRDKLYYKPSKLVKYGSALCIMKDMETLLKLKVS